MTSPDLGVLTSGLADVAKPFTLGFPRMLAMLTVFPLLPTSVFPLLVRNGIGLALLLPVYPLLRAMAPYAPDTTVDWLVHMGREIAIGAAIGWAFGIVIWAFEGVGGLLDIQTGASSGATFDPASQQPAAVFSTVLRNIAIIAFIGAGGLAAMLATFYESLRVWPLGSALPLTPVDAWQLARTTSTELLSSALAIALPFLVLLLVVELGLGLLNRSLPQLNVFQLGMPIKMLAAMAMLVLALSYLVDLVAQFVGRHQGLSSLGIG
jgi:type III secretion protein T